MTDHHLRRAAGNPKGDLLAALQAQGLTADFRVNSSGPPHALSFSAEVWCDGQVLGRGEGRSRREAERAAAQQALEELTPGGTPVGAAADHFAAPPAQPPAPLPTGAAWPIHPTVLAEALAVAGTHLLPGTPLPEIARQAAALYRDLLTEVSQPGSGDREGRAR